MLDRRPPLPSAAGDNLVVLRAASRAEPSQGRLQLSFTEGVVVDRCGRLPTIATHRYLAGPAQGESRQLMPGGRQQ